MDNEQRFVWLAGLAILAIVAIVLLASKGGMHKRDSGFAFSISAAPTSEQGNLAGNMRAGPGSGGCGECTLGEGYCVMMGDGTCRPAGGCQSCN